MTSNIVPKSALPSLFRDTRADREARPVGGNFHRPKQTAFLPRSLRLLFVPRLDDGLDRTDVVFQIAVPFEPVPAPYLCRLRHDETFFFQTVKRSIFSGSSSCFYDKNRDKIVIAKEVILPLATAISRKSKRIWGGIA